MIKVIKATIIDLIVAFFIVGMLVGGIYLLYGQKVKETFSLISKVTIEEDTEKENKVTEISTEKKALINYPEYGTQYATIQIPTIDVNLPVYFGDTLEILKKGVGHDSGSYFPGEGGSILYSGHNFKNFFRRFSELKIGDKIKITTSYGEYNYNIYDMQIIKETDVDKAPIQKEKEILMVYTCYPFNNIGYATQRYMVYAELEK